MVFNFFMKTVLIVTFLLYWRKSLDAPSTAHIYTCIITFSMFFAALVHYKYFKTQIKTKESRQVLVLG